MNIFYRIIGLIFVIIPFFPTALLFEKHKIKGAEFSFGPYQWLLGLVIIFFIAYILSLTPLDKFLKKLSQKIKADLEKVSSRFVILCMLAAFTILNLCSYICFRHRPHLVDSIVQVFQAKIFAAGSLKALAPKYPEFFMTQHMLFDQTGWYSQYPPGHQALLAIGTLLGIPWAVNILLTLISIYFSYKISLKVFGEVHAKTTLILAVFCPFLFFMGSDFMNHVPTLTSIILFSYFYICWEEKKKASLLLYSALAIGFAFTIRPLTALGMAIPFGISALIFAHKNKLVSHLFFALPGVLLFIGINCYYNYIMFGSPTMPGYIKLWGKGHDLGFHLSPWGEAHTPLKGMRNELADLSLLNEYLYEWPIPILLFIGLYLLFFKDLKKHEKLFLCSFLMLPTTYFFYWHRDAYLGPRFMYEGVIFLIFLTSSTLIAGADFIKDKRIGKDGILKPTSGESLFIWALTLCFIFGITIGIPSRFTIYATSLKSLKFDIATRAKAEKIDKAIIFIKVSWGVRLMSELRSYGISAALTQIAYSNTDHCRLQELLDQATANSWTTEQFANEIQSLINKKTPLLTFLRHVDTTLKLSSTKDLSPKCNDELAYDTTSAFTVYAGMVAANSPKFDGDYIVAMDLRSRNHLLREQFPDYPAYIYLPDNFAKME